MNMTCDLPSGFTPPDGVKDGKEFDALGTFVINGGKISLVAIEGNRVDKNEKPEPEPKEPMNDNDGDEYPGFLSGVEKGLAKK